MAAGAGGLGAFGTGAWRRLRNALASDVQNTGLYRLLGLRTAVPAGVHAPFVSLRLGDAAKGERFARGVFRFGEERVDAANVAAVWSAAPPSHRWRAAAHRFDWLADLLAVEDPSAATLAQAAVDGWIDAFGDFDAIAWSPEHLAPRLTAWLRAAPVLFADDAPGSQARLAALARQAKHLENAAELAPEGLPKLHVAAALSAVGLCLPDHARAWTQGSALLARELTRQILPDGGHVSRAPEVALRIAADAAEVGLTCDGVDRDPPPALADVLRRMTPMLRFFETAPDQVAAFHGGGSGDPSLFRAVMALSEEPERSFGVAPHSLYHRLDAGEASVLMDVGWPAEPPFHAEAHASPLAVTLTVDGHPIVTSCGWSADQPARFRDHMRATAAHSALVVEDTNAIPVGAGVDAVEAKRARTNAGRVSVRRSEDETGVWIEGVHEGYRAAFGVVHQRRVFLSTDGRDFRGEDVLAPPATGHVFGEPRAVAATVRFHIHPAARVELARDGRSAVISAPGGPEWRLRTDAMPIALEPSIHLADGPPPRHATQIVLSTTTDPSQPIDRAPNRVRWAFRRIGAAAGSG